MSTCTSTTGPENTHDVCCLGSQQIPRRAWSRAATVVLVLSLTACSKGQGVFASLLTMVWKGIQEDSTEPQDQENILQEYDFIIVGAGTAGCTLANRLTEVPGWKVLLLEAGGSENFIMDIPILTNYLQFTEANWRYKTVPSDKACLGLTNKQCNYPRGKVMGGSSVINYMIYSRGNPRDYDNWEKMGNRGWGWKDVLPYFKKSEDMADEEMAHNSEYHNKGGYLTVAFTPYHTKLAEAFIEAGLETGEQFLNDYNGQNQTGYSYIQATLKNGTRWSASRAFLRPISNRTNLHVKKRSLVTRITIDAKTKTAYGVEFHHGNRNFTVRAKKEVIVSSGAINSPQLLMLSGIGPTKHLQDLKIPIIKNLKVGYNLMDHVSAGGITHLINESISIRTERIMEDTRGYVDFLSHRRGPWSVPGGCEALAFLDLKNRGASDGWPDVELLFQGGSLVSDPSLKINFGINDEIYNEVYKPIETKHAWQILPMLLRPKSKGRIMLQSKDPRIKPLIFHNYYNNMEDLETMVEGIKRVIELGKTKAFQGYNSTLHDIPLPGCKQHPFGSDEYWGCQARHLSFTIYHQSGTCKMGPSTDRSAVVDPRLRVYGVKRLRVIDASIMPMIPAAHTNGPVYMIAEKGADLIKEYWGIRRKKANT